MSHKKEEVQKEKEGFVLLFQELAQSLDHHENAYAHNIAQRIWENQSELKQIEANSAAFALRLQRLQGELSLAITSAKNHYKLTEEEQAIRKKIDDLAVQYYTSAPLNNH